MRPVSTHTLLRLTCLAAVVLLAGCEIPGLGPDPRIAARLAEGKAIGGACRYAVRGIEDCYELNDDALKTAVFEGWKEMDQYMRDNKIEGVLPKPAVAMAEEAPAPEGKSTSTGKGKATGSHAKAETGKNKSDTKLAQKSEEH